jgi:flavin-dependent dehydrogenase
LRNLGLPWPLPIPQIYVDDACLVYGKQRVHVRAHPQFVVFLRSELDAYLAGQARRLGVTLHENEALQTFTISQDGVLIQSSKDTYRAQVLVGADGSKGAVRRILNRDERRSRVARLLEVYCPASPGGDGVGGRSALFDFTPLKRNLQGYFWDFPTRLDGALASNRGVYDARLSESRGKADLKTILGEGLQTLGTDPNTVELAGHPIHWFSPYNRFSAARLLLVGDAAGADPLFGEGIAPALAYGGVAAQAIQEAFTRQDFSFRGYRRRVFNSPLGRYLLLRWVCAWWAYRLSGLPGFMPFVWALGGLLARLWPALPPLPEPEEPVS